MVSVNYFSGGGKMVYFTSTSKPTPKVMIGWESWRIIGVKYQRLLSEATMRKVAITTEVRKTHWVVFFYVFSGPGVGK